MITINFSLKVYLFIWKMHSTTLAIIVKIKKWEAQYVCNLPFILPVSIVAVEYISSIAAIIPMRDTIPWAIFFYILLLTYNAQKKWLTQFKAIKAGPAIRTILKNKNSG